MNASLGQGLFSDPIDKTITSFVVYVILAGCRSGSWPASRSASGSWGIVPADPVPGGQRRRPTAASRRFRPSCSGSRPDRTARSTR